MTTPDSRGIHSPHPIGRTEPTVSDPSPDGLPEPSPEPAEPAEPATVDWQAQATEYKNRFAGSQKSLTETQKERDALRAEAEALRKFKAEQERANMSELDAAKADAEAARQEAAAARAEAARERLARKFPRTAEVLGDQMPSDETILSALEQRLIAASGEPSEPEPTLDPNNPRKAPQPPAAEPGLTNDAFLNYLFPNRDVG